MVPFEGEEQYALTGEQNTDGQWRLTYKNEKGYNYNWCFVSCNGYFALKWCGSPDTENGEVILCLKGGRLSLAIGQLLPEHYIHSFSSTT